MKALEKAIQLNPNHSIAHNILARAHLASGNFEKAIEIAQQSVAIDPLTTINRTTVADIYYFWRKYDRAVLAYRMAQELDPRFDGIHLDMGRAYEALGRFDEARVHISEGMRLTGPKVSPTMFALAHLEIASGNETAGRQVLKELVEARESRPVSAWGIAALYVSLGEIDEAFHWFEVGEAEMAGGLLLLLVVGWVVGFGWVGRYYAMLERLDLND
jgi:tetratricopeptide (TPR) repeat protein